MTIDNNEKRRGALGALKAILASRQGNFKIDEQPNKDGQSGGGIEPIMPKHTIVEPVAPEDPDKPEETPEEKAERIKRINDPAEIEQDLQDIETDIAIKKGNAQKAKKDELKRIAQSVNGATLHDFSEFSDDLYQAIRSQITQSKNPEDSFSRVNPTYAGSDLLMPGQAYTDKKEKPVINVYFDQSGSWGSYQVEKGKKALASLSSFERKNKIKINLFYFANHLHDTPKGNGWSEGGTHGFPEVLAHISASGANNVIILTDDDIESQTSWNAQKGVTVKGCVWWLWKEGKKSKTAPKYLKGLRSGDYGFQYNL